MTRRKQTQHSPCLVLIPKTYCHFLRFVPLCGKNWAQHSVTDSIFECVISKFCSYSSYLHCGSLLITSTQPVFQIGRKLLGGGTRETSSTLCTALKYQNQVRCGNTQVTGSFQTKTWTIGQNEYSSVIWGWTDYINCNKAQLTCSKGQLLAETATENHYTVFPILNTSLYVFKFILNVTVPYRPSLAKSFRLFK